MHFSTDKKKNYGENIKAMFGSWKIWRKMWGKEKIDPKSINYFYMFLQIRLTYFPPLCKD